jgi:hypothetical protein
MSARFALFAVVMLLAAPADAALVPINYYETMPRVFAEIGEARGLSATEAQRAATMASLWFYVGPCKGSPTGRLAIRIPDVIGLVGQLKPSRPFEAAVLEMIGELTVASFGRDPPDALCDFALNTGQAYQ